MAKANKVKNLTLAELKKQNKKLDAQKEVTILIGDEPYTFMVDEVFRTTKKHKVLNDMVKLFNEARNNDEILAVAPSYTSILVIKHFTNIEVDDSIDGAIAMLETLVDLGILADILNEFPEDELVGMLELLTKTVQDMNNNIGTFKQEADEIADQIENPELKEMLTDGDKEQE